MIRAVHPGTVRKRLQVVFGCVALLLAACGGSPAAKGIVQVTVEPVVPHGQPLFQGFGADLWLVRSDGLRVPVSVPAMGSTAIRVPPGRYEVTVRGKMIMEPYGQAKCSATAPVNVTSRSTTAVLVTCMGH